MPIWKPRDYLANKQLGPAPDCPPWRLLPSKVLVAWFRTTLITLSHWRRPHAGGPRCYQDGRTKRFWYRHSDVRDWLADREPDWPAHARAYLQENRATIELWLRNWCKPLKPAQALAFHNFWERRDSLNEIELHEMLSLLDKAAVFGRVTEKPKRLDLFN